MTLRRSALGRGLGALIPGAGAASAGPAEASTVQRSDVPNASLVNEIAIDRIEANPDQPRRSFASEQLESLTASIRRHGVLQPVVVRPSRGRPGNYELIVGERRWRAARAAGLKALPAVTTDTDAGDLLELAIVENVQRHDLNPMELAHAYQTLVDRGATQDEISEQVSMGRSSVANHLRLLDLTRDMQEDLEQGRLTMGHAKALLQVSNPERRRHLRDLILEQGLSVREAERRARDAGAPARKRVKAAAVGTGGTSHAELTETLQRHVQSRVRIHGQQSGRLEIDFSSPEDLDRIAGLLLDSR